MSFWKDLLKPGRWFLRDGRCFEVKAGDIPHFAGNLKRMVDAGLHVPLCWEHQADAKPRAVPLSAHDAYTEAAKRTITHVEDVRVNPQGVIEVKVSPEPDDEAQLRKTKFVSPWIEPKPWTDDTGREWPGWTIQHVAVTPTPINRDQRPFGAATEDSPVAMSRARFAGAKPVGLTSAPTSEPLRLSGAAFEEPNMADKPEDDADDTSTATADDTATDDTTADAGAGTDDTPNVQPTMSDDEKINELIECLEKLKIHVGPGTNKGNLLERLLAACHTAEAHQNDTGDAGADTGTTDATAGGPVQESTPSPVLMSRIQVLEKGRKDDQGKLEAVTKERDHYRGLVHQRETQSVKDRILAIGKALGHAIQSRLLTELKTTPVALSATGAVQASPLLARVETYEETIRERAHRFGLATDQDAAAAVAMSRQPRESAPPNPDGVDTTAEEKDAKEGGKSLAERYLGRKTA